MKNWDRQDVLQWLKERHMMIDEGGSIDDANFFPGVVLTGEDLRDFDLERINFEGADLWKVDLRGVNLEQARLKGANLKEAKLDSAKLQFADMRKTNLQDASLCGCRFSEC